MAGIAGVLLTSSVSSGTPGIGSPYLLNAYAAAFLGATQFGGRFNAWGTVMAVILLGTGTTGLYLVGGAAWTQSMFTGVVLLLALGASNLERAVQARSWIQGQEPGRTGLPEHQPLKRFPSPSPQADHPARGRPQGGHRGCRAIDRTIVNAP